MAETLYYSDQAVQITSAKATFGGREFDVSSIASVDWHVNPADKTNQWHMLRDSCVGCAGFAILLSLVNQLFGSQLSDFGLNLTEYGALTSGICSSIGAYLRRERYIVTVQGNFGKVDVVVAWHLRYALQVVRALNRARHEASK